MIKWRKKICRNKNINVSNFLQCVYAHHSLSIVIANYEHSVMLMMMTRNDANNGDGDGDRDVDAFGYYQFIP